MPCRMATRFGEALPGGLRFEPTPKWVRGQLAGVTVVDSRRALLVWEPDRVVPTYCVPKDDVEPGLLRPAADGGGGEHTAPVAGAWSVQGGGRPASGAAWSYADADLDGYIAFEFAALDRWLEEEEETIGHPRDPFKRIDVCRSSRHVVVEVEGRVVGESRRPRLLFETHLPVRYYLPREDVRMDLLRASEKRTICAYKGEASYFSVRLDGRAWEDVAWTYEQPLAAHRAIEGLIAFLNERLDITVDGERQGRPRTQWSG
jgi:uncharacterized protein (DUF427 family)